MLTDSKVILEFILSEKRRDSETPRRIFVIRKVVIHSRLPEAACGAVDSNAKLVAIRSEIKKRAGPGSIVEYFEDRAVAQFGFRIPPDSRKARDISALAFLLEQLIRQPRLIIQKIGR